MTRSVVMKNISMPRMYLEKIRQIKEELGLSSDSEVVRRAIDSYAKELGLIGGK